MPQLHVLVRGMVQGVGFRWFVRDRARAYGLWGWVRNHPDGSVELLAVGKEDALRGLREAVLMGPIGARVEGLTDLPAEPEPEPGDFRILK